MTGPAPAKILYFAYGSNLSLTQMASRCPTSTYHALGALRGWKWIIGERGYANIVVSPAEPATATATAKAASTARSVFGLRGKSLPPADEEEEEEEKGADYVIGMLYHLGAADETVLDQAEGVPYAYEKQKLEVSVLDARGQETGQRVQALVYVDVARTGTGVCREEYVGRMNRGVRDAEAKGMSARYVEKYLRPFVRKEVLG
ncbi:hypothetical protein LHYA1_G002340 [Lachnellula hyalina]|uniref:gamma-glutamylcyclotransferase n=1 Tax=Lachnellula hyalina TaxID=1316788 RepID=A0A8H8U1T8_9HELO|nr:uncharacterized protein LHYA1_G002340 [Lachnellula hyalina]TVY28645.1 hypothetical protein LHYA1_G002340 [Lachnellula hyalina]